MSDDHLIVGDQDVPGRHEFRKRGNDFMPPPRDDVCQVEGCRLWALTRRQVEIAGLEVALRLCDIHANILTDLPRKL